ncbi:MAG TPA: hypothetical protein VGN32_12765 [Ktedonobacterales bacterium]|nr:hypothetical protein [Ktedonobacterales bacterium]
MGDDFHGRRHDASRPNLPSADELERQAREALAQLRERVGGLGDRVRRVMERASTHWEASAMVPSQSTLVPVSAGERARVLARRWADIDFLVDPELSAGIAVHAIEDAFIWRAEARERGETRLLEARSEPYLGTDPPQAQPVRPLWEYTFPVTPDIISGEQRERLPGTGSIDRCHTCDGRGNTTCHECAGQGTHVCPRCHGRARVVCGRCRGRGRISDSGTLSESLIAPHHLADHAEKLLGEAGERIAGLRERLRLDLGVPPPPAHYRGASTEGLVDGIPCPDCDDGTRPCDCEAGRRACATCAGSGQSECASCRGTGRVVHHREVVRRFDTRAQARTLPVDERISAWAPVDVLTRGTGEQVWHGPLERATADARPSDVPDDIWQAAIAFGWAGTSPTPLPAEPAGPAAGERHIIARSLTLLRLPLTRLEYAHAGRSYTVVAFGRAGAERFWAEAFPHRWSRVGRFLRALSRDLDDAAPASPSVPPLQQSAPTAAAAPPPQAQPAGASAPPAPDDPAARDGAP